MSQGPRRFLFFAALLWILPGEAAAYLDPGSGSYMIQVLIGLLAGLMFTLRSTLARGIEWIKRLFRKTPRNKP